MSRWLHDPRGPLYLGIAATVLAVIGIIGTLATIIGEL